MRIHGEWILTPWRLAFHEPTKIAVIADMHLGYDLARRHGGEAVPLMDWDEFLAPLMTAAHALDFRSLVIAGDLFERGFSMHVWSEFQCRLRAENVELAALVPGNHDRGLDVACGIPVHAHGYAMGKWTVIHGDVKNKARNKVMGHWHPCVSLRESKVRCFLASPNRLVLPAYSPDAAGVNVWRQQQWRGYRCLAIVGSDVLDLGIVPGSRSPSKTASSKKNSRPWTGRLQRG